MSGILHVRICRGAGRQLLALPGSRRASDAQFLISRDSRLCVSPKFCVKRAADLRRYAEGWSDKCRFDRQQ